MSQKKHGVKALGISLMVAFGLMAVAAVAAQAAPHFNVGGSPVTGAVSVLGNTTNAAELTWELSGSGITISCKKIVADGATINTSGTSDGTLLFSECEILNNEFCTVSEPIEAKIKDQLIVHNGKAYDLFEPLTGGIFTEIEILNTALAEAMGEECVLFSPGTKLKVTGSTVGEIDNEAEALTHTVTFSSAISELFKGQTEGGKTLPNDELKLGANKATFMGKGSLFLCNDSLWSAKKE